MSNTYGYPMQGAPPQPGFGGMGAGGPKYPNFQPRNQSPAPQPGQMPRPQHPHQQPLYNPVYTLNVQPQGIQSVQYQIAAPQAYYHQGASLPRGPVPSMGPQSYQGFPYPANAMPPQNGGQPGNVIYSSIQAGGMTPNLYQMQQQAAAVRHYLQPGIMQQQAMGGQQMGQMPQHMGAPAHMQQQPQQQQHMQQQQQQPQPPKPMQYQQHTPQVNLPSMSSAPPPATTPPHSHIQPVQYQEAVTMPAPAPLKPREKRGIQIIDPSTGKSIFDTDKPPAAAASTASTATTPVTQATDNTQTSASEPRKPVSDVAAEFAAKVAAVADSANKVEEPRPQQAEEVELHTKVEVLPRPLLEDVVPEPLETPAEQARVEPAAVPPTSAIEVSPSTPTQDQELLSVVTEVKREDSLYEPVSPTPLPDSPVDEVRGHHQQEEKKATLSPQLSTDDGFTETMGRKKKQSAASKRAELNRKGLEKERKGSDLLEVFTETARKPELPQDKAEEPPASHRPPPEPLIEKLAPLETTTAALPTRPMKEPTPLLSPTPPPMTEPPPAGGQSVSAFNLNGLLSSLPSEMQRGGNHVGENHINNHAEEEEEELEEGELQHSDDETPGSREPRTKTLKYEYKEDQWSPLNPEGKKQYDREFLICLQNDPLSLQKPNNLPVMEIVKDKPNVKRDSVMPFRAFADFTPNYVHATTSRQGVSKRASKSKEPIKPPRVIQIPSFSQDVQLHKADNAWTPLAIAKKKGADIKQDELDDLAKKVRSILNKLTPQKFDTLVQQFQELPIDSQLKLTSSMELIFEKALDEPSFSVAYAQMCRILQLKKVPMDGEDGVPIPGTEVAFRKLLISRCQAEFEKDYMDGLDKNKYEAEMADPNVSDADKKKLKDEFVAREMRARRRSLGNIRFIGELYKLGMLTVRIMHECVAKLLREMDEESLECLCRLMTTVGQELESETKFKISQEKANDGRLRPMEVYFREMSKIIDEKKTSSRVRFLMQDVVDLRNNRWQKRREDAGPKTIDQIHEEMKNEQLKEKLNLMAPPPPPSSSSGGRGGGPRDVRDDLRKRSGTKAPLGGGGQSEDGWQAAPTRAAKISQEKFDAGKIKSMISKRDNIDDIQLGPSKKGWGQGSAGTKSSSRHAETTSLSGTHNKFSALSMSTAGDSSSGPSSSSYEGRTSGGFSRSSRPGMSSASGPSSMSSSYMGRSSRGQSTENDRAKALQAVREMGSLSGRSTSTMAAPPSRSEAVAHPPLGTKSASMMAPIHSAPEFLLKGDPEENKMELEKKSKSLIDEFLSVCDYKEAYQCISELFHLSTISFFVQVAYESVLEGQGKARENVGKLLSELVRKQILSPEEYLKGVSSLLEIASDLLVDIPKFWDFFAAVLAPSLLDASLPMKFLQTSCNALPEQSMASKYVAAVLHEMARSGPGKAGELWQNSGLRMEDFLTEGQNVEEFIRSNKLEFSLEKSGGGGGGGKVTAGSSAVALVGLSALLARGASNEEVQSLLDQVVSQEARDQPQFIRALVTAVVESCIEDLGGPHAKVKLSNDKLINRCPVLVKYVDMKPENELQALLALQRLMVKLEHPNKLLHSILQIFYDSDTISEEGFQLWEKNTDPAEQEGKGVAMKSCVQFITWIAEQEEDDPASQN